jgi:hypothetical protein
MPMYRYYCPNCQGEKREFHSMDDRHQDCDCGMPLSIVPQRLNIIRPMETVDMTLPLGPNADGSRKLCSSKRVHADMLKQQREDYHDSTGIDLGELHVHETEKPRGKNTPMSVFDSSVPFGKTGETMEQFQERMDRG